MSREEDLSELEKEIELEFETGEIEESENETAEYFGSKGETGTDEESENEGSDFFGYEGETGKDEDEDEFRKIDYFADKLLDLSTKEFETEFQLDGELDKILTEMEREYFWNPFKAIKKAKKWATRKLRRAGRWAIKKGKRFVKNKIRSARNALRGVTGLLRGNLKGLLAPLFKSLLGAASGAVPGGPIALPAIKALLGFETAEDSPEISRNDARKAVMIAKDAYGHAVTGLEDDSDTPEGAMELASESFRYACRNAGHKITPYVRSPVHRRRFKIRGKNLRIDEI